MILGSVSNTDIRILNKIKKIIGSGSIVIHQKYKNDKNWKISFRYQMPREIMRILLPQLNFEGKNEQKNLVLTSLSIIKGHKGNGNLLGMENEKSLFEIIEKIRTLNNRGLNSKWNKERIR